MTPVPWAACCKQRRYGDRSPASYTSIRSTTFSENPPEEKNERRPRGGRAIQQRDELRRLMLDLPLPESVYRALSLPQGGRQVLQAA